MHIGHNHDHDHNEMPISGGHGHDHGSHNTSPAEPTDLTDSQAVCSVTGDVVEKKDAQALGHVRDYNGHTYYFCCGTCVQLFNKNPEKYTAVRSQQGSYLTLIGKEHLIDNVWSFRFRSQPQLEWTAGQFIRIELPHDAPDDEGTRRWFTISSAPDDGYVQITTRLTDTTFKKALAELPKGGQVNLIEQPDGSFVWQDDERPLVFVAGGIGVTPFYSMIKSRGHSGQTLKAILVYNGRDDNLPFKKELEEAAKRHPELHVEYVIGERVNVAKLQAVALELNESQVYLSGPEAMVQALGDELERTGLPISSLHQDFFPKYSETNF